MSASGRPRAGLPTPLSNFADALPSPAARAGDTFDMPLTQEQISEALGITPVHANRIIRQLRDDNIVDISRGRVTVLDETKLAELAQFDDRYLHQDPSL